MTAGWGSVGQVRARRWRGLWLLGVLVLCLTVLGCRPTGGPVSPAVPPGPLGPSPEPAGLEFATPLPLVTAGESEVPVPEPLDPAQDVPGTNTEGVSEVASVSDTSPDSVNWAARWLLQSNRSAILLDVFSGPQTNQVRAEALEAIGLLCDLDQDGRTTWEELAKLAVLFPLPQGSEMLPPELLRAYDSDGDNQVAGTELGRFLARGQVVVNGWLAVQIDQRYERQSDSPLLRWLDQNGDSQLDADEMENAAERLRNKDADGDGLLWPMDFSTSPAMMNAQTATRPMTAGNTRQYVSAIDESTDWNELAFELEQRFSFGPPLLAEDLPTGARLERLEDVYGDGDGVITPQELRNLAQSDPDLAVWLDWRDRTLRLATDESEFSNSASRAALPGMTVELSLAPGDGIVPEFGDLDLDSDGRIEPQEFASRPNVIGVGFGEIDRDGSQAITKAEFELACQIHELIDEAFVSARVFRSDDPLFGLLDQDGNGRIDRRETDAAVDLMRTLANTTHGVITPASLAGSTSVAFSRGLVPQNRTTDATADPPIDPLPAWFQEMDLDRNGVIGALEFPGDASLFQRLDADGDGQISWEEAQAAID